MRILVAYGSSRGGTAGLAEMIGEALREREIEAEVRRATPMLSVEGFDAVIVGGALYAMRWHKDARRFVKRNLGTLPGVPVYFFSSGPLDDSATTKDIPPVKFVATMMERVGALGHVTFGGRLEPDAKGLIASKMAKNVAGDHRSAEHVDEWVGAVVNELERALEQTAH